MFGSMAGPGLPRAGNMPNQAGDRHATLGRRYQAFSNPFFDLAGTYTPPTIKALFAFCRHYHLTHGVINAIITKASEYPVTDLILSHKDRPVKDRWDELLNGVLNYRVHQFEVNLEYFVFGNAFVSPSLPFTKVLKCAMCGADHNALQTRTNWRYSARGFWLSCTKCGQTDYAKVRDDYYPRLGEISIVRWNPELVNTYYNEATGRTDYTLDFSAEFKNGVTLGRKDLVATTPQAILEAIKTMKTLVFDANAVFHMRRPGLSGMNRWGIPLMMPILKDAFFMQIMKKAQECVTPDTLIDTARGLVRAGEVIVGDEVRTHLGRMRKVTARADRALRVGERAYEITTAGAPTTPSKFSETHPCVILRHRYGGRATSSSAIRENPSHYVWAFVEAQHIKPGDYAASLEPHSGEGCFPFGSYYANQVMHTQEITASGVIDFEVADDHTFCTPGMVVHNSVLLTHLVPQVFLFPQPATSGADPFCVSPTTLIEVPGGVKPASEIRTGDYLRSHTGAWREVEDVVRRRVPSSEKVYRFVARTLPGFPFVVSEEHPILAAKNVQKRSGQRFDPTLVPDPAFIEAKNLAVGDFVTYPVARHTRPSVVIDLAPYAPDRHASEGWIYARYKPQGIEIYEYFEEHGIPSFKPGPTRELEKWLEAKGWDRKQYEAARISALEHAAHRMPRYISFNRAWARVLGYFLAEGHTSDHCVGFAFHKSEQGFIDELTEALTELGFKHALYPRDRGDMVNVLVHDTLLAEVLQNMCCRYAANKQIPAAVAEAEDELVFDLLRCLFNGDGCVLRADTKGTPRVYLKTTSPHLAIETRRLLLSMGYIGGVSRTVPRPDEIAKAPYYQVYYNGAEGVRLGEAFGWTVVHRPTDRPERNAFIRDGYLYMRLRSIDAVDDEPEVIGFQMAVDHTFCVAGVASHNTTTSLADWKDHIRRELARQRVDPSYFGILPFPLGHQTIGEHGKSLLLMPEIQSMAEHICIGMGFPVDLVFGNGTYAGSSVNMRMLENFFMSNMHGHIRMAHWVVKHFGSFLNWPTPDVRFKAFRMADDVQRSALFMQLAQQDAVSETSLLSQLDLKVEDETQLRMSEMVIKAEAARKKAELAAEVNGAASVIMAKYQALSQGAMQAATVRDALSRKSPFEASLSSDVSRPPGITLDAAAAALADAVKVMPPERQAKYMEQLRGSLPELGQMVDQQQGAGLPGMPDNDNGMGGQGGQGQPQPGRVPGIDNRPLPEVLPPRRAGGV